MGGGVLLLNTQQSDYVRDKLNTFVVDYRIEDVRCRRIGNFPLIKNRR
jgi:hypothetical protein